MSKRSTGTPASRYGMRKRFRLRRAEDFARLRRIGRRYHHPLLSLSLAPNGLTHNRYGFVTTKRLGKAVTRNRVRRLLRESVRLLHTDLVSGFDLVIIARPAVVGKSFPVIQQAIEETLRRAGIMNHKDDKA